MTNYKLGSILPGETESKCVQRLVDGVFECIIPFAEGNTDYQEYLAWVAEGNEPLPADD